MGVHLFQKVVLNAVKMWLPSFSSGQSFLKNV